MITTASQKKSLFSIAKQAKSLFTTAALVGSLYTTACTDLPPVVVPPSEYVAGLLDDTSTYVFTDDDSGFYLTWG